MSAAEIRWTDVVALDGPSGTGKSTVARRLAARLGSAYLDTGATYRAATLAVLRAGVDLGDAEAIAATVAGCIIEVSTDPRAPATVLDASDVDGEIRGPAVTAAVSAVSAVAPVRVQLVEYQREVIRRFVDAPVGAPVCGIVVEGRDIASVVWPQAAVKVFLTASPQARARRRAGELAGPTLDAVAADIARRDRLDSSRAASPFAQDPDSTVLDTTELEIDEVVERLVDIAVKSQ